MPEKKIIASFYKFIDWSDFQEKKPVLEKICRQNNIVGTILLAPEGINGTISGSHEEILKTIEELKKDVRLSDLESKFAEALGETFKRMKIRLKKEIVSMGKENINPGQITGTHVSAEEWNQIIQDPNTLVVDTRNKYEHAIGNFEGSIDPKTTSFRQFPKWVEEKLKPLMEKQNKTKVAMFCTGGIRCEKASSFLLQEGFEEVLQLQGGILKYLEKINLENSLWEGECFVFDDRVSIQHGLLEGNYTMCHACRMPIDDDDLKSNKYKEGISCPHCYGMHTEERKQRFAERQKQIKLAKQRNETHIGKKFSVE